MEVKNVYLKKSNNPQTTHFANIELCLFSKIDTSFLFQDKVTHLQVCHLGHATRFPAVLIFDLNIDYYMLIFALNFIVNIDQHC